jgi:hypothetical protein
MSYLVVSPAMGRDYTSKAAVLADWEAGKDFRIESIEHCGRMCSNRDTDKLKEAGVVGIEFRYKQLRSVFILNI